MSIRSGQCYLSVSPNKWSIFWCGEKVWGGEVHELFSVSEDSSAYFLQRDEKEYFWHKPEQWRLEKKNLTPDMCMQLDQQVQRTFDSLRVFVD